MAGPYSSGDGSRTTWVAITVAGLAGIFGTLLISNISASLKLFFLVVWTAAFLFFILYVTGFIERFRRNRVLAKQRKRWFKEAPGLLTLLYSVIDSMKRVISTGQMGAFPRVVTQIVNAYTPVTGSYGVANVQITMGQFPGLDGSIHSFGKRLEFAERKRNNLATSSRQYAACMGDELRDMIWGLIELHDEFGTWSDGILKTMAGLGARCPSDSVHRNEFDQYRNNVSAAAAKLQELLQESNSIARRMGAPEVATLINKRTQVDFF